MGPGLRPRGEPCLGLLAWLTSLSGDPGARSGSTEPTAVASGIFFYFLDANRLEWEAQ